MKGLWFPLVAAIIITASPYLSYSDDGDGDRFILRRPTADPEMIEKVQRLMDQWREHVALRVEFEDPVEVFWWREGYSEDRLRVNPLCYFAEFFEGNLQPFRAIPQEDNRPVVLRITDVILSYIPHASNRREINSRVDLRVVIKSGEASEQALWIGARSTRPRRHDELRYERRGWMWAGWWGHASDIEEELSMMLYDALLECLLKFELSEGP